MIEPREMMRVCVPVVHWQRVHDTMFWCVKLAPDAGAATGISKDSSADASQVRALDVERFLEPLGVLDSDDVDTIAAAAALCVGYTPQP